MPDALKRKILHVSCIDRWVEISLPLIMKGAIRLLRHPRPDYDGKPEPRHKLRALTSRGRQRTSDGMSAGHCKANQIPLQDHRGTNPDEACDITSSSSSEFTIVGDTLLHQALRKLEARRCVGCGRLGGLPKSDGRRRGRRPDIETPSASPSPTKPWTQIPEGGRESACQTSTALGPGASPCIDWPGLNQLAIKYWPGLRVPGKTLVGYLGRWRRNPGGYLGRWRWNSGRT